MDKIERYRPQRLPPILRKAWNADPIQPTLKRPVKVAVTDEETAAVVEAVNRPYSQDINI